MKKFFLFVLLFAATAMMADIKVETFAIKSGGTTGTYVTDTTSRTCSQATWTFLGGGLRNDVGNFSSTAAAIRAKYKTETIYPFFESDSISGGIDSLWFTWNSNGSESGTWGIKVYINGELKGSMTEAAGAKDETPSKKFGIGQLQTTGKFVIKITNESSYNGSSNKFRFVFDDLSWTTYAPGEKSNPQLAFESSSVRKVIGDAAFTNALTNHSDATPSFKSSVPEVATVDPATGEVTIVGVGYTTITASVEETETYKAEELSYTLRVVPANWKIETFSKISKTCVVCPTAACATEPVTDTLDNGVAWTYWLGGANDAVFGNRAMYIRARLASESEHPVGFAKTDSIEGGLSRLFFNWRQGGKETGVYNIAIVVNGDTIGSITDKGENSGDYTRNHTFEKNDLTIEGKFLLEIINLSTATAETGNTVRIVINDLEWEGYEAPCEGEFGILVDGKDYIAGELNTAQTSYTEYMIVASLEADQTIQLYDNCSKSAFLPNGQEEGGYWFTVDGDVWSAPAKGIYTIYLKMYGYNNNWIYTSFSETTGVENTAVKADVRKAIENGQIVIYRNGVRYSLQGQQF